MDDSYNNAEAFRRFMKLVTGSLEPSALLPDADEVRINALEREVRALGRSVRRQVGRRKDAVPRGKTSGK